MGAFTPFKRRANQFKYTPRYYDPAKEAREERREELFGTRSDSGQSEYRPGQYIRTQRSARSARNADKGQKSSVKMWISIAAIAVIAYMGSILYTKLVEAFGLAESTPVQTVQPVSEYEEFDPTAPITIVPNDYDPSQEE